MKSVSLNSRFGHLQLQSPALKQHRNDLTPVIEEPSQVKETTAIKKHRGAMLYDVDDEEEK